jgi:glucans biosynthesis protein C
MDNRRYDIDWLRVIAIGLLIIYHTAIVFQPWGLMIGFTTNKEPWEALWKPMMMLNIWRIPLLFFISGMGVYFSFQSRNVWLLINERATRILVPFVFGSLVLVPLYLLIMQKYYDWNMQYIPSPGHLWFLGNIFVYVVLTLPFMILLKKNNSINEKISKIFSSPISLIGMIALMVCEAYIINPPIYEMYAMTWHGFALGFLAFIFGYIMAMNRRIFEKIVSYRFLLLGFAFALYLSRLLEIEKLPPNIVMPIESMLWIFAIFGLGYKYLNFSNKTLSYLSSAAYPFYIIHMLFLGLGSMILLPLNLVVQAKFIGLLLFTFSGCLLSYELIIKRFTVLRFLFGIKKE